MNDGSLKPLSWKKYVLRNKRKTYITIFTVILGVFLLIITKMVIYSIQDNVYSAWALPFHNMSAVVPIDASFQVKEDGDLHDAYIDKVFIMGTTGRVSTYAFFVTPNGLEFLKKNNEILLKGGSYPKVGSNEIVIHEVIAQNKGLKIGDRIGKEVDNDESLIGDYTIVGIISGEGIISIGDHTYYKSMNSSIRSGYLFPKDLYDFDLDKEGILFDLYTYEEEANDITEYGSVLNISMVILIVFVYLIIGFLMLFMLYVFYNQRKREFGILLAIGYRKSYIVRKSFYEIISMALSGFFFGVISSLFIGYILNLTVFGQWGQNLTIVRADYLIEPFTMIILIVFLATAMVSSIIKKVDAITLIEGE